MLNRDLGFDAVLQMVDKADPYQPITVVPTHSVLHLPSAVSVIVAQPDLRIYAKDPESGEMIQLAGPLEPDRAEAKARASMLSLLDSPRPGMVVEGDGWTAVALSHGVWEFEESGERDSLQYFSWKRPLGILREAVRGGAIVRLPKQEQGECAVCKGRGGPVSSACQYDFCHRCGKKSGGVS